MTHASNRQTLGFFLAFFTLASLLIANPAFAAKKFKLEFDLPEDISKPPRISSGSETIIVLPGDELELTVTSQSGPVMLIIESENTPFASGKYRVTVTPGNSSKKLRFADAPGEYKYSLVDVSDKPGSETRPVYDPVIIIKDFQ